MVLCRVFLIKKRQTKPTQQNLKPVYCERPVSAVRLGSGRLTCQSSVGIEGTRGFLLNADELFARNIQKELWASSDSFVTQAIRPACSYCQLQTVEVQLSLESI